MKAEDGSAIAISWVSGIADNIQAVGDDKIKVLRHTRQHTQLKFFA